MKQNINNLSYSFEDRGEGIPILFIHGYPLTHRIWQPQIEGLSDVSRVIAPDLRGHGDSETSDGEYSMELLADDCAALLDALSIQRKIVICGLSMGGYVAFAFSRKYASRLAGMILTATRAGPDNDAGKTNRDKTIAQANSEGVVNIIENMLPKLLSPKSFSGNPMLVEQVRQIMRSVSLQGFIGDLLGMKIRPDSTPLLAQINIPTLLVFGNEDQIIPLDEAKSMHKGIRDSRLEIIPDCGHLSNLENPQKFNDVVRNFITKDLQ